MGYSKGRRQQDGTYKVRAYLEYEIEASSEKEAIERMRECVLTDLSESESITEISEVAAEKISDTGISK